MFLAPRSELTSDHLVILQSAAFFVDSPTGSYLTVLFAARRMAFPVLWYWPRFPEHFQAIHAPD